MPVAKSSFTVRGHGPFPIDMLRYDSAWPEQAIDAAKISDSFNLPPRKPGERREPWEVRLWSADQNTPTIGRWNSFNVRVID